MAVAESRSRKVFAGVNATFLSLLTLLCILPFVHLFAVSLSSNTAAMAGRVSFWPINFSLGAYRFLSTRSKFLQSLLVSLERLTLGVSINMLLVCITAYPLSKDDRTFRGRTAYVWFFVFTMLFGGGLIPTYMVVKLTGLMDTIWALVIPGAVNVWFVVMLLNFFRGVPRSLEEAAVLDGAGHMTVLFRVYLPVSLPALATILLFAMVDHWNAWFDGIIYMNTPAKYPLQTYISTLVTAAQALMMSTRALTVDDLKRLQNLSPKTLRTAQIFLGALPIMAVYPFLQRYFIKGIVLGSVKE
jgi:putative aldouronate transport system permease protein